MKNKLKSYSFWIAIASSVMIFLQTLGTQIDIPHMDSVINAFLGIFVVLGIIDKPSKLGKNGDINKILPSEIQEIYEVLEDADSNESKESNDENVEEKSDKKIEK